MIEIGKIQQLKVLRIKSNGIYLGEGDAEEKGVLLPAKQVPAGAKPGDLIPVFIYKDSEDRLIATTKAPLLKLGELAVLEVKEVGKIGAFLNWGLERDLFLPFKQQRWKVRRGEKILAALYVDKSQRLCATTRVDQYLTAAPGVEKDHEVQGVIYEINPKIGAFVAVDKKYFGLIPAGELSGQEKTGEEVSCRVSRVREDGKLTLSLRKKAYKQMDIDAESVYALIEQYNGKLPFTDKADADLIKLETGLSKNAFKRAVGHLLKDGRIKINETTIDMIGK